VRVGVTGSSGFIGTALVRALHQRGDVVTRFVRPESASGDSSVVRWDPSRQLVDESDLARVAGFDAVFHLAGAGIAERRWSEARKKVLVDSRVDSTRLLVQALRSLPSGTLTLASGSAIGFYGSRGDEWLDERSTPGDDFLSGLCTRWEDAASALGDQGTVVTALRTGIVLDQTGGALKRQLPLFRLGLGGQLATGRQWLSPISLNDHVRALLWVIEKRIAGPVNLVCPTPLTNKDFTKILASALHRRAFLTVPSTALRLALGSQLANEAVLASQRVVPQVLADGGFLFNQPDARSIIEAATLL
jgi:uncharacterized protein (TIGR01777 family)